MSIILEDINKVKIIDAENAIITNLRRRGLEPWNVELTYFNENGKFKYTGHYDSNKKEIFEIWNEVQEMFDKNIRPGLVDGPQGYYVLVNVPGHPNEHPHLILPK